MKHSHWLEFIEDWGDCVGGYLVGYSVCGSEFFTGMVGISMVLASIFLKHYHKP